HADRVGALTQDRLLDLGQQNARQLLALLGAPERVRVRDMRRRDRGLAERLLEAGNAGERERPERDAVVGGRPRDRLRALRLAVEDVVLAGELPGGLDRLRAAAGEEDVLDAVRGERREAGR